MCKRGENIYKRKDNLDVDKDDIDNQEICNKLFKDVVF